MPTKRTLAKRACRHLVDATVARKYRERAEKAEHRVTELEGLVQRHARELYGAGMTVAAETLLEDMRR